MDFVYSTWKKKVERLIKIYFYNSKEVIFLLQHIFDSIRLLKKN